MENRNTSISFKKLNQELKVFEGKKSLYLTGFISKFYQIFMEGMGRKDSLFINSAGTVEHP